MTGCIGKYPIKIVFWFGLCLYSLGTERISEDVRNVRTPSMHLIKMGGDFITSYKLYYLLGPSVVDEQ